MIPTPTMFSTALARNVVTNGYQASHSNDELEETEYLKLVQRYLAQARELEKLAGPDKVDPDRELRIHPDQRSAENAGLPHARRVRQGDLVLETVNAQRAFITTDSGFPLAELEQALRTEQAVRLRIPSARSHHPLFAGLLAHATGKDAGRFHRCLSGRPRPVPLLSGHVEAGSGNGRRSEGQHFRGQAPCVVERARFLWRQL